MGDVGKAFKRAKKVHIREALGERLGSVGNFLPNYLSPDGARFVYTPSSEHGYSCVRVMDSLLEGDPLSPFLFSTLMNFAMDGIGEELPNHTRVRVFMDDIVVVSRNKEDALTGMRCVQSRLVSVDLTLKSELTLIQSEARDLSEEVHGFLLPVKEEILVPHGVPSEDQPFWLSTTASGMVLKLPLGAPAVVESESLILSEMSSISDGIKPSCAPPRMSDTSCLS